MVLTAYIYFCKNCVLLCFSFFFLYQNKIPSKDYGIDFNIQTQPFSWVQTAGLDETVKGLQSNIMPRINLGTRFSIIS